MEEVYGRNTMPIGRTNLVTMVPICSRLRSMLAMLAMAAAAPGVGCNLDDASCAFPLSMQDHCDDIPAWSHAC